VPHNNAIAKDIQNVLKPTNKRIVTVFGKKIVCIVSTTSRKNVNVLNVIIKHISKKDVYIVKLVAP